MVHRLVNIHVLDLDSALAGISEAELLGGNARQRALGRVDGGRVGHSTSSPDRSQQGLALLRGDSADDCVLAG